jgi:hypothetical protein
MEMSVDMYPLGSVMYVACAALSYVKHNALLRG